MCFYTEFNDWSDNNKIKDLYKSCDKSQLQEDLLEEDVSLSIY